MYEFIIEFSEEKYKEIGSMPFNDNGNLIEDYLDKEKLYAYK